MKKFLSILSKIFIIIGVSSTIIFISSRAKFTNYQNLKDGSIVPLMYDSSISKNIRTKNIKTDIAPLPPDYEDFNTNQNRKFIQNLNFTLESSDPVKDTDKILNLIKQYQGFLINKSTSSYKTDDGKQITTAHISVRVNKDHLDEFIQKVKNLPDIKVQDEHTYGYDITESYDNISKRLELLKQHKQRIEELYKKATDLTDLKNINIELLDIQRQIDDLEAQLTSIEKKQQYILVNFSIVQNELSQKINNEFNIVLVFKNAYITLIKLSEFIVSVIIYILVLLPIWGPALFIIKKVFKKQIKNRTL